jgi:hypothetical protein
MSESRPHHAGILESAVFYIYHGVNIVPPHVRNDIDILWQTRSLIGILKGAEVAIAKAERRVSADKDTVAWVVQV